MLNYKVKLVGGEQNLKRELNRAILEELTSVLGGAFRSVESTIQQNFRNAMKGEIEYLSLMGAGIESLKGHFGIANTQDVEDVVTAVSSIIGVNVGKTRMLKGEVKTSFGIGLENIRTIVEGLIDVGLGGHLTEKGEEIPWIDWLILRGNQIIIREYDVLFKPGAGRSHQAIMVGGRKKRWRVPPMFQGTANNNWITRSLLVMEKDVQDIVTQEITKRM